MNPSQRRIQEELRMVERQLPLYYQKVNELERRQQELQTVLEEQDASIGASRLNRNTMTNYTREKSFAKQGEEYNETLANFELPPKIKTLGAIAKTNVIRLLGDARGKFHLLSEGMSQAVTYMDTMLLVLNLMEQGGGELHQQLMSTASSIQQQVKNPSIRNASAPRPSPGYSDQTESNGGLPIEALMEIIKSPHFQQLADQIKATGIGS